MPRSLVDIATAICPDVDTVAKPVHFYVGYERYFAPLVEQPITVLELGVHSGKSLRVWGSYFDKGTVIGIDLAEVSPDFSGFPNIVYATADQTDRRRLDEVRLAYAPSGFDLIIDDASHIGHSTAISFKALFPYLKSGGFYVIEDWGTGYFDDWPDGGHYQKIHVESVDGLIPKRLPSHDFGMVGFVKSLVDEVAGDNIKATLTATPSRVNTVEFMHLYKGFAILKKS